MEFELIKELIELIDNSKLTEFQMSLDGFSLKMQKGMGKLEPIDILKSDEPSKIKVNNEMEESALGDDSFGSYITSPIVGTYYSSKKVGTAPFIKLGDRIKKGQGVCIVEILNIINEIKSDVEGEVVEILVSDECMVEYGQRLFRIK